MKGQSDSKVSQLNTPYARQVSNQKTYNRSPQQDRWKSKDGEHTLAPGLFASVGYLKTCEQVMQMKPAASLLLV